MFIDWLQSFRGKATAAAHNKHLKIYQIFQRGGWLVDVASTILEYITTFHCIFQLSHTDYNSYVRACASIEIGKDYSPPNPKLKKQIPATKEQSIKITFS